MLVCACGPSSTPNESAIFYDANLRPGVIGASTAAERELLIRLSELPETEPVQIGDRTFILGRPYAAASGRRCRLITTEDRRRLACQQEGEEWVYVPDVQDHEPEELP